MKSINILTIEDLMAFEQRLKTFLIEVILEQKCISTNNTEYLRTREVKKLLKVSDNKLKSMRELGVIPYSFIGKTYYYPKQEILNILENNMIKTTN